MQPSPGSIRTLQDQLLRVFPSRLRMISPMEKTAVLTPPVIEDIRALVQRSLKAGLIDCSEIMSVSRIVGALQVEEELWKAANQPAET